MTNEAWSFCLYAGGGLVEFGDSDVWATDRSVSVHSGGREKFPEWGVQVSLDCTQTTLSCCNGFLLTRRHTHLCIIYFGFLFKLPVITAVVMIASVKSFPRMKWALTVFLSDASCAVILLSPLLSDLWLRTFCGSYWLKTLTRDWALDLEEQKISSPILSSRFLHHSWIYCCKLKNWQFCNLVSHLRIQFVNQNKSNFYQPYKTKFNLIFFKTYPQI